MAEPVLLRDCRVWNGPYALHRSLNRINLTAKKAELGASIMGDVAETFHPGLQQIDLTMGGRWASDAIATSLEPDTILYPRVNPNVEPVAWAVTVAPPNAPAATPGAAGNVVYNMVGKQYSYSAINGAHGELLGYEAASRASSAGGGLYRGNVLLPDTNVSVTTTGTAFQLGAVSATQKIVCVLHVIAINGGSWVATIESDTVGFPSATVRATFTAATTITTQVIEVAGAITDDYWRCVLTKTGGTSCTAVMTLAIAAL